MPDSHRPDLPRINFSPEIAHRSAACDLLSASIVTFQPDLGLLKQTLISLDQALTHSVQFRSDTLPVTVTLVDNDSGLRSNPLLGDPFGQRSTEAITLRVIAGHGNVGYGRGHNLALQQGTGQYHLVLNPDVDLAVDALSLALRFMDEHPEVGVLAPHIEGEGGQMQYLCRQFPSVFDLFARGFLPSGLRVMFAARLARYEMRERIDDAERGKLGSGYLSPPIISGCFMLFRSSVLKQIGGFDPRYFLYFEDYDLSLRAGAVAKIAYVPTVRIIHFGGGASKKGWLHIKLFASSAFKFFNRFGWRWI